MNEAGKLQAIEKAAPEELDMEIQNILTDVPRTGRRRIFSGEQIAFTMKRACQKPSKFGYERAQWTCALLAVEAVRSEAEH